MRGTVNRKSLPFDLEIENIARRNQVPHRKMKQANAMVEIPEQMEAKIQAEYEGRNCTLVVWHIMTEESEGTTIGVGV